MEGRRQEVEVSAAPVPRRLPFVVVKRNIPRFRDSYGHWWIEVDGTESYGWWSMRRPLSVPQVIVGTHGTLNGVGGDVVGGTLTTDPRHGEDADFAFHPLLLNGKSDDEVRNEIRHLATSYGGRWGWPWWWCRTRMTNCHTFQLDLFAGIGLYEGSQLAPGQLSVAEVRPGVRPPGQLGKLWWHALTSALGSGPGRGSMAGVVRCLSQHTAEMAVAG